MPQNEAVINRITTIKSNWEHRINHSLEQHKHRVSHLLF